MSISANGSFRKLVGAAILAVAMAGGWVSAAAQDGVKGKSIAIIAPQATGLVDGLEYLPVLVQGELVNNFAEFSGMKVLDRENLYKLYKELDSPIYEDDGKEMEDLGNLARTDFVMGGRITRTASGYALQLNITKTAKDDKTTIASYSGTCTFNELDNFIGVRRASLELLQKISVTLSDKAKTALAGAAKANHVSAQTALSQGIMAQRKGTDVAALSYFYQAASFDPSLTEAVKQSSVISANIKSGNIGADVRNDIVWRREWTAKLTETEDAFRKIIDAAAPPYTLFYSTGIETQKIDYKTETADLSTPVNLTANREWFAAMDKSLQAVSAVLDGLNSTQRKNDWGYGRWPEEGVTNTNPFNPYRAAKQYDMTVVFELVDQHGRVIGTQTVRLNPSFMIRGDKNKFTAQYTENTPVTLTFKAVKADDISDDLLIRVATINGAPPETARFAITAITAEKRSENVFLRIEKGVVMGFAKSRHSAEGKALMEQHKNLVIPGEAWGQPVTAIADKAFENCGLTSVVIPNSVTTIGNEAFYNNALAELTIGNNVTSIGDRAFAGGEIKKRWISDGNYYDYYCNSCNNKLSNIVIPNSVRNIGENAFACNSFGTITIGENVTFSGKYNCALQCGAFGRFIQYNYGRNKQAAGTYEYRAGNWKIPKPKKSKK